MVQNEKMMSKPLNLAARSGSSCTSTRQKLGVPTLHMPVVGTTIKGAEYCVGRRAVVVMMALFATTARGSIGPFHRHTFAQSGASPLSGTAKRDSITEHRFEAGASEQAVSKHAQQYCAKNQKLLYQ